MNENISDSELGRMARAWYIAETRRVKARKARRLARESHLCENEVDYDPENSGILHCYADSRLKSFANWCDNCKYVQPFWATYITAAEDARRMRYQLTRRLQRRLESTLP